MYSRHVSVLIVGAGPAGLYTSLFLARAGTSEIAVIEKRAVPTQVGHASGIHPRTQEIMHTLGTELSASISVRAGILNKTLCQTSFVISLLEAAELLRRHSGRTATVDMT